MQFRGFQAWLHERLNDVDLGVRPLPTEIILDAGCGGGKSVAVLILAYWLIERLKVVDRIIWVVPNGSLRRQAAQACGPDEVAAKLLGHQVEVVENQNSGNPAKGKQGYVVTYSAISAAFRNAGDGKQNPHVEELLKYRYALVADEPHHLAQVGDETERGYSRGIEPLMRLAKIRVFMSGTLFRHDRKPIAFLPYLDGKVDIRETDDRWFYRYTIRDAIQDQAVIKTEFHLNDGRASWIYAGQPFEAESLDEDPRALLVALQTQFANALLRDTVQHWKLWRAAHHRSKLLVVCASVAQARWITKLLLEMGVQAETATYQDDDSDERIERFKGPDVDALITVNKAYEGLDVPQITHVACLTRIRSIPWINQMLARAWRYDRKGDPYQDQAAFIFAPADSLFRAAIELIWEAFQHRVIESRTDDTVGDRESGYRDEDGSNLRSTVTPRDSAKTLTSGSIFGGDSWKPDEMRELLGIQGDVVAQGFPPTPLDLLAAVIASTRSRDRAPVVTASRPNGPSYRTPGQRLRDLRADLQTNVRAAAHMMSQESGLDISDSIKDVNRRILQHWRPRDLMEEDELSAAISWVRQFYGLD